MYCVLLSAKCLLNLSFIASLISFNCIVVFFLIKISVFHVSLAVYSQQCVCVCLCAFFFIVVVCVYLRAEKDKKFITCRKTRLYTLELTTRSSKLNQRYIYLFMLLTPPLRNAIPYCKCVFVYVLCALRTYINTPATEPHNAHHSGHFREKENVQFLCFVCWLAATHLRTLFTIMGSSLLIILSSYHLSLAHAHSIRA